MTKPLILPEPGDIIAGKYRVERVLGEGGMGAVFEVSHQVMAKRFAIKWLLPELWGNSEAAGRLVREARVTSRFAHPNVVQVYDIGEEQGSASYIVMELLEGESLADKLKREGRLSIVEACRVLLPCMEAMSAAHAAGIVHRDLKPANIFLCRPDERPKLLDFGIAKLLPSAGRIDVMRTQTGAIVGTPHYMAPEQMRGLPIDARVDVYALGVTLYELLSGRRPFEADTYAELVLKITEARAVPLHRRIPELPRGVSGIVSRAMASDPRARTASVEALIHALAPYRDGKLLGHPSLQKTEAQLTATRVVTPRTPLFSESIAPEKSVGMQMRWLLAALALLLGASVTAALLIRARRDAGPSATERAAATAPPARPARASAPDPRATATENAGPNSREVAAELAHGAPNSQPDHASSALPVSALAVPGSQPASASSAAEATPLQTKPIESLPAQAPHASAAPSSTERPIATTPAAPQPARGTANTTPVSATAPDPSSAAQTAPPPATAAPASAAAPQAPTATASADTPAAATGPTTSSAPADTAADASPNALPARPKFELGAEDFPKLKNKPNADERPRSRLGAGEF